MNREQIIQMASEAGINVSQGHLLRFAGVEDDLEKFAAAIRAATKEEDSKICRALWRVDGQFTADEFADEILASK